MTAEEIIAELKQKKYRPVYFLMGEEPYYIDKVTDFVTENILDESEKEFNLSVLYGKDVDAISVINSAKRYPMMAPYQVIVVKEAQNIRNIEALETYVANPVPSTILVIAYKYKTLDKRKSFPKTIEKSGILFNSEKLRDDKVPGWIIAYLKEKKYTISAKGSMILSEYLGNDLSKIVNEVGKLMITIPAGREITEDDIQNNIGISKDYNVFELQNALSKKEILKVNKIINYFTANPKGNPLPMVLPILAGFFAKVLLYHYTNDKSQRNIAATLRINPFFVKDYEVAAKYYSPKKILNIISLFREYDLKSKGVDSGSTDAGGLLKELTFKILH